MWREPQSSQAWRTLRMRYQHVERIYGQGNADNGGDDIVEALRKVSSWPEQFPYRFRVDLAHPNPYYHAFVFEIQGMPDEVFDRFIGLLAELGLIETAT